MAKPMWNNVFRSPNFRPDSETEWPNFHAMDSYDFEQWNQV